jgi:16S rRNA (cytosine1407-C5)-methyltransferase
MDVKLHPDYLQHISSELDPVQFAAFQSYCRRPLRKSIRVNRLKCTPEAFRDRVARRGWKLDAIPWCSDGFWLQRPDEEDENLPLGNTPEHLLGLFYIQEASSMLPPEALLHNGPTPRTILDVAAAPGSKTTQLAAMTGHQSVIVANELSSSRLKGLYANLVRTGAWQVCLTHHDGRQLGQLAPETFDAVLLDAPCGGEGTVRKDPDALKDWSLDQVRDMADLQSALLEQAFLALREGGHLVYSTCTLSPEENEQVLARLLQRYAGCCEAVDLHGLFPGAGRAGSDHGSLKLWPHLFDSEGFFVAKVRKTASTSGHPSGSRPRNRFMTPMEDKVLTTFLDELENWLAPVEMPQGIWCQKSSPRGEEVWLLPGLPEDLFPQLYPDRCGIRVAEMHRKGRRNILRWHHEFAIACGHLFTRHVHDISLAELADLYRGKNLASDTVGDDGDWLVRYQQWPVGWVRKVKQTLKNNLPRDRLQDRLNWESISD